VKRAQYGDIGRIVCGEATYFCGPTFDEQIKWLTEKPNDPEVRLRAWGLDRALSGDIITEQNIHALDVASWVLDAAPLSAAGTGGRRARAVGTCWDQYSVIFTYPKDVTLSFASKQLGQGWDDICCRIYGTEGTLDTHYFGEVSIKGKLPYRGGKMTALYQDGAVANIAAFHDGILRGDFSNPTVAPSVRSTLTTILGRTAAWRGAPVTWDEMTKASDALPADLSGLRS
jgi:myo-inositol 2-dehydrogenase / D-chiro-inositol 1-dehydrogenase